ncbi:LLM class F420-dependent oxidoreductase [Pseudonocardia alaniniphila]|uniref:LLM class F420-dependent oxidoreductase n=1 Tax=Pseudonocardia alaniniphila TaxID=75291 RepID=A0ABS9T7A1_9PSEU|nr:LLM class F420-dependent oxidoreductase [Pseudonocardia alaniniphila]MCH6164323.1 LLM class F420-dependent oxidoreductase [Pseudonocardia alaniniphila]
MKFGIGCFVTDEGIAPGALGRAVEERGLDALFVAEHSHIPASRRSPYPSGGELPRVYYRALDPFVALTAAAAATSRLVLGTGIALLTQRDPISTAKEVASLDLVSGGRFAFGVGVGWNREEMENHGTDPTTRGRRMDENIEAMQRIWTEEQAEFHGEFVNFDPIFSWPKPVQKPHPPIYVGGGEANFRRIARFGARWLPNSPSPEALAPQLAKLRDLAGADVVVSATHIGPHEPEKLAGYEELGVERVTLQLPTAPEGETLGHLDQIAQLIAKLG